MSQKQVLICKFNQTGFCKFKEHCKKEHNNEVCGNLNECKDEKFTKRHPNICKNFTEDKNCRHKDRCAYLHTEKVNYQTTINEQVTLLILKHEKDIAQLTEEVNTLKTLVNSMSLKLVSYSENQDSPELGNEEKDVEDEAVISDPKYECSLCNFKSEKQITLNKHMNTKHEECKSNATSNTQEIKEHRNSFVKNTLKAKFYCDVCDFSSTNKKSLKKHMDKGIHTDSSNSYEEIKNKKENPKIPINEPNKGCAECSKEEACEGCIEAELDEIIAKGNSSAN